MGQAQSETAEMFINKHLEVIWIEQAINHEKPELGTFRQQVYIYQPTNAGKDATVFFILGNESDSTGAALEQAYLDYGMPQDMVFIIAEHRGYGQSITPGDQSKPEYVQVEQALEDYHQVITLLKTKYTGDWIVAGYSYGAALAINFAMEYPDDISAVLSSSAPIHWPFLIPQYSEQVSDNLGLALTQRLNAHIENLEPEELYDENWENRELVTGIIVGLSQMASQQNLMPYLNILSFLPTPLFISALNLILPQAAWDWVEGRKAAPMPHDRAIAGHLNWYTWKYQQCTQVGTFFSGSPFTYTREEHINDCMLTFDEQPGFFTADAWDVAGMIERITVPLVIVVGGRDPWSRLGVKPNHLYNNIDYLYVANGYHCPDRGNPEIGEEVLAMLLGHLK